MPEKGDHVLRGQGDCRLHRHGMEATGEESAHFEKSVQGTLRHIDEFLASLEGRSTGTGRKTRTPKKPMVDSSVDLDEVSDGASKCSCNSDCDVDIGNEARGGAAPVSGSKAEKKINHAPRSPHGVLVKWGQKI